MRLRSDTRPSFLMVFLITVASRILAATVDDDIDPRRRHFLGFAVVSSQND
jgi:hypothetical protein